MTPVKSPLSNLAFGRFSDLARAIATSLMSMPTTDRALPKTAWVKWPFAASELKNGFAPDEWLQTSAQDLVPELRVRNMPGVRSRIIEIEICSRSHCRFPPVEKQALLASSQQPIASRLSLAATPIACPPFRAIAPRKYQRLSVPGLARLTDCQAIV